MAIGIEVIFQTQAWVDGLMNVKILILHAVRVAGKVLKLTWDSFWATVNDLAVNDILWGLLSCCATDNLFLGVLVVNKFNVFISVELGHLLITIHVVLRNLIFCSLILVELLVAIV